MEFIWQPKVQVDYGEEGEDVTSGIFTHIMSEQYQGPCGIDIFQYTDKSRFASDLESRLR